MFDRDTESFWIQLLLGAQCGPKRGTPLNRIPVIETTWGYWKELHPTSTVVSNDTGHERPYGRYPYGDYSRPVNAFTLVPSAPWNTARPPKELVLGIKVVQFAKAYPFGVLEQLGQMAAVNDLVGPRPFLVTWLDSDRTAQAFDRRVDGNELNFVVDDVPSRYFRDHETGSTWNAHLEAIAGPLAGKRLSRVTDSWALFWFSWSVYNKGSQIYAP